MSLLKKYPALSLQSIAGLVTAVLAVWADANATGTTDWWLLALGLIPLATGFLTHGGVVPVDAVKGAVVRADTWADAGGELARRVGVAVEDRPLT